MENRKLKMEGRGNPGIADDVNMQIILHYIVLNNNNNYKRQDPENGQWLVKT